MSAPTLCEVLLDEEERRVLLDLLDEAHGVEPPGEPHRAGMPGRRREAVRHDDVVRRIIAKLRVGD